MSNFNVLVLGREGQIARALGVVPWSSHFEVTFAPRTELDLADPVSVRRRIQARPWALVVNCGAYTQVDAAEKNPDLAFAINGLGPAILAEACRGQGSALIHLSTDYVFDGRKGAPYDEDDAVNPICVYGASKAAGDEGIRNALPRHIILRTSWVFSPWGDNFLLTMLRAATAKKIVRVVNDQYGCPTYAPDVALVILGLAQYFRKKGDLPWGTYHFCGGEPTTWFHFAEAIFAAAKKFGLAGPKALVPISTAELGALAKRPSATVLNCDKINRLLKLGQPRWRHGVHKCLAMLRRNHGTRELQRNSVGGG